MFYSRNNPGIHYEFYTESQDKSYTPKYLWDFVEWTDCDAKCGGGAKVKMIFIKLVFFYKDLFV